MSTYLLPIAYTVLLWWLSTGVILHLVGLPRWTHRWTMLGTTVLLGVALVGLYATRDDTRVSGAYLAFTCTLVVWAWQEVAFLLGYVTGPRRSSCPPGSIGWRRAGYALQTLLHHELALIGLGLAVFALTWGGSNPTGLASFLIFWVMRQSAKLNIYFGVRNLSEGFPAAAPEVPAVVLSPRTDEPAVPGLGGGFELDRHPAVAGGGCARRQRIRSHSADVYRNPAEPRCAGALVHGAAAAVAGAVELGPALAVDRTTGIEFDHDSRRPLPRAHWQGVCMNDAPGGSSQDRSDLAALSAWAPELANTFVSLASDIALVIDNTGVIRSVAQGAGDPIAPAAQQWIGRSWVDTVSGDTRPKIENLLKEVSATGLARRREVNHLLGADASVPVAYTAIRLGANGPVLAVGRDLRSVAAIQRRYVESQQDMERGYWQARQAEARYQLLFQVATDAVVVVDGETLRIVEANQSAIQLFGASAEQLNGRAVNTAFEHHSRGAIDELLRSARTTGQSGEIRARLQDSRGSTGVSATPFRAGDAMRLLVRVRHDPADGSSAAFGQALSRLVDGTRDGVVVTDPSGRVLIANPAFLALARLESEALAKGQPLMRWLSLADEPLAALLATVRRDGVARHVASIFRCDRAAPVDVEISAALLADGDQERIGFTIHPVARGVEPLTQPSTADALTAVLRAGIDALRSQMEPKDLAALIGEAGAALGLSAEALHRRIRHDPDAGVMSSH